MILAVQHVAYNVLQSESFSELLQEKLDNNFTNKKIKFTTCSVYYLLNINL